MVAICCIKAPEEIAKYLMNLGCEVIVCSEEEELISTIKVSMALQRGS
jgi:hypothetical protein